MGEDKAASARARVRGEPVRARILDAAERLLRQGEADFSMRDLATGAGVSFVTPFNHFGGKPGVMQALSLRRIETMQARFEAAPASGDARARVLCAVETAAAVMLEEPAVNRVLMGWLGAATPSAGETLPRSTALWALALGAGDGLAPTRRDEAVQQLPELLAFAFRGVLSFWAASELPDARLAASARAAADALLRGYL